MRCNQFEKDLLEIIVLATSGHSFGLRFQLVEQDTEAITTGKICVGP